MHVRLALVASSALVLSALLHCAGSHKPTETAVELPPRDAAPDPGGEGGAGGAMEQPPERPRPDPALVQKALDRTGASSVEDAAAHGLRLEVVEIGPGKSWGLAVVNRGMESMGVAFDPRLLELSLQAPADTKTKRLPKPRLCRLPEELRPKRADAAYTVVLAPGRGLVEAFDPRLYCMPEGGVSPLVPGVTVSATLGWPVKTKTVWRRGKRVEEVLPQVPPFVAAVAPPEDDADAGSEPDAGGLLDAGPAARNVPADASSEIVMTDTSQVAQAGIKQLKATPFELGGDYTPPPKPAVPGLTFELTRGSDAASEAGAMVTAQLKNRGSVPVQVYFRRELVTLEVSSVDGTEVCLPGPDDRAPDRQAFTHLAPGGSVSVTSRLAELCQRDTFARPGLYLIHGSFDGLISGHEVGFDAFVGRLASEQPATVRIRTGHLPFPGERTLEEVQVGATAPQ